jgi:sarcosine oxidase subunit alpha
VSARGPITSWRLPTPAGRLIDRDQAVEFSFDGRAYRGLAGDTIASALYANGVRMLSRSFKYHRPRGAASMRGAEANTLVQIGDEPNVLADLRPIAPGLQVASQNRVGSLDRDYGRVLDRLGPFMPVGFYYKAFYKPKGAWRLWQGLIRRLTGLGTVDRASPHGYYDKAYLFPDVVVVGGGAAGMAAAATAVGAGAEVLLVDEMPALGGALSYTRFDAEGRRGEAARTRLTRGLDGLAGLEVMTEAVATGLFPDNWLSIVTGRHAGIGGPAPDRALRGATGDAGGGGDLER